MHRTLVCLSLLALISPPGASAAPRKTAAQILAPKRNEEVAATFELTGKVLLPGQPVVLVRPAFGDMHYWVQPPPDLGERGFFRVGARLGNDQAQSGSKFYLSVVILRSPAEIAFFQGKEFVTELPAGLACSEEIPVRLKKAEDSAAAAYNVTILRPQPNAKVRRLEELVGQSPANQKPTLLVRSEEPNGEWWVQNEPAIGRGGYFKSVLHFGNERTPNGTWFRVIVVSARDERDTALLRPGTSLLLLPHGIPRSQELRVELENPQSRAK